MACRLRHIFSSPLSTKGCVQQVCTRNVMSLRHPLSCNTIVTNLEVQDTDFLDTPKACHVKDEGLDHTTTSKRAVTSHTASLSTDKACPHSVSTTRAVTFALGHKACPQRSPTCRDHHRLLKKRYQKGLYYSPKAT